MNAAAAVTSEDKIHKYSDLHANAAAAVKSEDKIHECSFRYCHWTYCLLNTAAAKQARIRYKSKFRYWTHWLLNAKPIHIT